MGLEEETTLMDDLTEEKKSRVSDPFDFYLNRTRKHPLLKREEEIELFKRIEEGTVYKQVISGKRTKKVVVSRTEDARRAVEEMVEKNLRLVVYIAKMYGSFNDLLEYVGELNEALLRAIDSFEYKRGFKFSTYASRAIIREISKRKGIDKRNRRMLSLEDMSNDGGNTLDFIPDNKVIMPDSGVLNEELYEKIGLLGEKIGGIISLRYLEGMKLRQIARIYGISFQRVSQLERRGLALLRKMYFPKE